MSRRLLSAAAALTLLLGLAACGEGTEGPVTTAPPSINISAPSDGGGDPAPSDGGGETATEDPTAAAPDIPPPDPADYAGMEQHTPEGAEQAARYYVAVTTWGFQTGDLETHDKLVSPECRSCTTIRDKIVGLNELGSYWSPTTINDVAISHHTEHEDYEVSVSYGARLSPHTEPDFKNGEPAEVGVLHQAFGIGMDWSGDTWLVSGLSYSTEVIN